MSQATKHAISAQSAKSNRTAAGLIIMMIAATWLGFIVFSQTFSPWIQQFHNIGQWHLVDQVAYWLSLFTLISCIIFVPHFQHKFLKCLWLKTSLRERFVRFEQLIIGALLVCACVMSISIFYLIFAVINQARLLLL